MMPTSMSKKNPSFLLAVRYCREPIIRYLVEQGADVNGVNHVKTDAFEQAIYGKRYENLPLIHQLGHRVENMVVKPFEVRFP